MGPRKMPTKPKAIAPPRMPMRTRRSGKALPRETNNGLMTLSMFPTNRALQTIKKMPHAVSPDQNSQIAAGSQMIAGPPGMMPKKPVASPRRNGAGTPESQ